MTFSKCRLYRLWSGNAWDRGYGKNSTINLYQTILAENLDVNPGCKATCVNSIINYAISTDGTSLMQADNCIIFDVSDVQGSLYKNCIFITRNEKSIPLGNNAWNCVAVGDNTENTWSLIETADANKTEAGFGMFKNFSGTTFTDQSDFTLADDASASIFGSGQDQVGIYGGALPYNVVPNNPRITQMNVAKTTTDDGKLSVNITVEVPEQ